MTAFRNFPQKLHISGLHINGIQLYVSKVPHFGHQESQKEVFELTHHKPVMRIDVQE